MRLSFSICLFASLISFTVSGAEPSLPHHIFSNPAEPSISKIPTVHESAVLARRIFSLSSVSTLSTVFPSSAVISNTQDASHGISDEAPSSVIPSGLDLHGAPIGLMDYYASCNPQPYYPTILAISIATTFRNAHQGSNVSMSLRWQPPPDAPPSENIYTYSPANMPRFSLIGYIDAMPVGKVEEHNVKECFLERHPDAEAWLPGNEIHESWWARLVVQGIYWIGGFGDRAYIGWIHAEEWHNVTDEEIREARLVGEKGYGRYAGPKDGGMEEL